MRKTRRFSVRMAAAIAVVATMGATALWSAPAASAGPPAPGFFLLGGDGGVFPFGSPFEGSAASDPARCPANVTDRNEPNGTCWSMAVTPSGQGYWILNGDTGVIYPYGDAGSFGSPSLELAGTSREFLPNMLQIVSTPDGQGYWVYETGASGLGTVDHFGDAGFFGDTLHLVEQNGAAGRGFNGTPVGMAATPDGQGYWEVMSDGGVFAFGAAKFYGSTGAIHLTQRIIGITATADGKGYWLYAADGGVFAFGDAVFAGSTGNLHLVAPVVGMARDPNGPGYWLAAADGGVFAFGGAPYVGSLTGLGLRPHRPIVAIATRLSVPI